MISVNVWMRSKRKRTGRKERDAVIKKTEVLEKRIFCTKFKKLDVLTHMHVSMDNYPEEWLPEAGTLESAKSYRKRIFPLVKKSCEYDTGII